MVFCAVVIFYTLFASFVQCSTIITKSMIRTPNGSFYGFSRPGSQLPKPEMLSSRPSDGELQAVHPFKSEEEQKTSIKHSVLDNHTSFENPLVEHFIQLNSSKSVSNPTTTISENRDPNMNERKHTNVSDNGLENFGELGINLNTTISPKELSSKYWFQYNNFSNEFFNKWNTKDNKNENTESQVHKRYPESSILEMFQSIFSCFWTSELFSCVQDGFGGAPFESFPLFQLMMSPKLPRFQLEGDKEDGFTNRNDDFEYSVVEEGEGRKKLSKRLLQIIPFLVMLKMSMLPALAVMALVSGKAFLMSLLSLGVALVTTFSSAVPFRADKRHEIASQSPASAHPTDQLPGKYYYVM